MPIDWGLDLNAHAPDSNPVLIPNGFVFRLKLTLPGMKWPTSCFL